MGDYDFTHQHDLGKLPEIESATVRVLWSDEWYDGTLSGMAEVAGEWLYYDFYLEDDNADIRTFVVYRLTPEQREYESDWRRLEEEAGGQTTFDEDGRQDWAPERSPGARAAFVERKQAEYRRLDLRLAEVVGWFRDRGHWAFVGMQVHQGSD
ncbi:MAG: hypothetical protein U0556_08800 [Dehalococcoidia bacterium]